MYLEEMKIGDRLELGPVKMDRKLMLDFAERFNNIPLHTDEEYCKNTRFGQIIAPGMLTFMVIWAEYVKVDFAGEQLVAGVSSKEEWFAPVFADDELHATAEITALTPRNPHNGIMETTIMIYNQKDELVLKNVTESLVRRK